VRDGGTCALLKVEIGRIRQVTETLGHRAANEAIRTIAQRIQDSVRAGDAVARVGDDRSTAVVSRTGSDELAVLLPGLRRVEDAAAVARRLIAVIGESMSLEGHDWFPTVSIGIAAAPDDAGEPEALMHCARVAASAAREKGGSGYGFYSAGLNAAALERLTLEAQLRRALQRGEFELHYQPKVTLATGAIIGCEALIRWRHPTRGLVPPGVFISLAEEAGLIVDMGSWVLDEACRAARRWVDAGLDCRIAVNIAAPHFVDGRLIEDVRRALGATGLAADMLTTELTESMLMGSAEESLAALLQLKALGVSISLDDFGTGYSSLAYLKRMPLDELKIDRSFVSGLPTDAGDLAIVRAIIAMAQSLDLRVVAEGVELPEQAACLRTAGCENAQGWLFARAVPEAEFVTLLRQDRLARSG
jgi:EAL domain-containing protein (putative c-di-GMP-specific phosphodiesterase class I)/GGDEF domain-containing protein